MEITNKQKELFSSLLIDWHSVDNKRSLPWKNEKDPYRIWLSEILLQQTRALQALSYYLNFIDAYPTISDLANAQDDDVFRLWQGLGYYNRCKNMLQTARYIANELNGNFPNTYIDLLLLKGIGPYTAAAIASFAYNLPHAVVDGNVYRVLARYFGIDIPIDTGEGKKLFADLANGLLNKENPANYNQAIMDLGATVCLPANAQCTACFLVNNCIASKQDSISLLPVKSKKTKVRTRFFHYILFVKEEKIWIQKRTEKDIWQNLHEPYLIEHNQPLSLTELQIQETFKTINIPAEELNYLGASKQKLSHQIIEARFFLAKINKEKSINLINGSWLTQSEQKKIAFPKTVFSFLQNNFILLFFLIVNCLI